MQDSRTVNLFSLGQIIVTDPAQEILERADIAKALQRHAKGDWGDIKQSDKEQNDIAVREGGALISAYLDYLQRRFFIITEGDRTVTTILLPKY